MTDNQIIEHFIQIDYTGLHSQSTELYYRVIHEGRLTKNQVRFLQATMQNKETNVGDLCQELGVSRQTLYCYVSPEGGLRNYGKQVLGIKS